MKFVNNIKSLWLVSSLLFCLNSTFAASWQTISAGFWSDPGVWSGGVVPPYSSNDTFDIQHPIVYEDDLYFGDGAYVSIDTTGGLCAYQTVTLDSNAYLISYGIFQADTFNILFGNAEFFTPSWSTISSYGYIIGEDALNITGESFNVGFWFDCRMPTYSFLNLDPLDHLSEILAYPNPSSGILNLKSHSSIDHLQIYNFSGKFVKEVNVKSDMTELEFLESGIYVIHLQLENGIRRQLRVTIIE